MQLFSKSDFKNAGATIAVALVRQGRHTGLPLHYVRAPPLSLVENFPQFTGVGGAFGVSCDEFDSGR